MVNYNTIDAALHGLKVRRDIPDFNIAFDKIICNDNGQNPNEFEIIRACRFVRNTNPENEDTAYAIESKNRSIKGNMPRAYEVYRDTISNEMSKKRTMHE